MAKKAEKKQKHDKGDNDEQVLDHRALDNDERALLDAADGDPIAAASAALTEATLAKSPKEIARWEARAERLEALADNAKTFPFMAGGPKGARVGTAIAITEKSQEPAEIGLLKAENAALGEVRKQLTADRLEELGKARERLAALPVEFRKRVALYARIDWRATAGTTEKGIAVPGGGPGITEAEIAACELAVILATDLKTPERVEEAGAAVLGVPVEVRIKFMQQKFGDDCLRWQLDDKRLTNFKKAIKLAISWLRDPASVILANNPARVAPGAVDLLVDEALNSFGLLPEHIRTATPPMLEARFDSPIPAEMVAKALEAPKDDATKALPAAPVVSEATAVEAAAEAKAAP